MSAFIVISTDNRLHHLLDGIEKCRPVNPGVTTQISTGKITQEETGQYSYEYSIHGEHVKGDEAKSLGFLISNQLAAFRTRYVISEDRLVNIFLLENPLIAEKLDNSQEWIEELDKIYDKGTDKAFCLFRIVFSYDVTNPTDIRNQIDIKVLQRLLEEHKDSLSSNKRTYEKYLFYIDNQKSDAAALCLGKEEHDLKMSRFLLDFMMLTSNTYDSYSVLNSVNTSDMKCFSVGFAESMYYFPDVERYFVHADQRDLYSYFLNADDELSTEESGKESMKIDLYPIGLNARIDRLETIYSDIPFSERIEEYPLSADKKIDDNLTDLKEHIDNERKKEIEDFLNSQLVLDKKRKIETLQNQIEDISIKDGEEDEDFEKRKKDVQSLLLEAQADYDNTVNSFTPSCPEFINRMYIYTQIAFSDNDDLQDEISKYEQHYKRLLEFIISRKFLDYLNLQSVVNSEPESKSQNGFDAPVLPVEKKSGCLSWLFFWRKGIKASDCVAVANDEQPEHGSMSKDTDVTEKCLSIKELLELKKCFKNFEYEVQGVKEMLERESDYCDNFTLTEHTNHYCPLIVIDNLKEAHDNCFCERRDKIVTDWRKDKKRTKKSLIELVIKDSKEYTENKYSYIVWTEPFPFVRNLIARRDLYIVCNELQKRSAPFVNYNLDQDFKENKVIRAFYSDRYNFKEEFEDMRTLINNGNEISSFESSHIASKICMMQFLPMDKEIIDNLVDLQEE